MGRYRFITLFILGLIGVSLSNAFVSLIPEHKELVYDYKAHIRTGTPLPAPHGSIFNHHGKLHVQSNGNVTVLWLSDLKYTLYNGVLDHHHEHDVHEVPVPKEIEDLNKPFRITHDTDGKIMGIATESQKEYVRNMQKAIANIFQMDVQHVTSVKVPHGFTTEEPSIYGYGQANYNVMPKGDEIIVQKMHEMHSSHHIYQHVFQNLDPIPCETFSEPIVHDSQRRYLLVKQDGVRVVKHIQADGGYYYLPFNAKSDVQYLFVNQTFHLSSIVENTSGKFDMSEIDHNLRFVLPGFKDTENLPWHHDSEHIDMTKLDTQVIQMLERTKQYLNSEHMNDKAPNDADAALIKQIHRALSQFKVQDFEQLHGLVSQKTDVEIATIFYEVLPLIGTKGSSLFIRNLIQGKKVKNEVLVEILENYARHVMHPTENLVNEMEFLVQLPETMDWSVRKTAILAFGGLVRKAHDYRRRFHEHTQHHDHDYHSMSHDEEEEKSVFEKHLVNMIEKAKSSQKYREQIVYLKAIANMRLPSTVKHLMPVVEGEWSHDHNIRLHAMWAMYAVLDDTTAFEIMWPLLANHDEHTEIRILAYYMIMTKHPSLSRVDNIYWLLQNEPNAEVYHFHYTFVESMANSVEPCRKEFTKHLRKMLKMMQPVSHGLSTHHVMDFKDVNYGFTGGVQTIIMNSNTTLSFTFSKTSQILHQLYQEYLVQVRVNGLKSEIKLDSINPDQVWKLLKDLHITQGVSIEIVVVRHGMVENVYFIDEQNHEELTHICSFLTTGNVHTTKSNIHITFDKFILILLPTDLGMMGTWAFIAPSVEKLQVDMKKEMEGTMLNVKVDNHYTSWVHTQNGFTVYNPVIDIWHGAWRSLAYNVEVPIFFDVTWNKPQQSLKLSWRRHSDVQKDVGGVRTHATQYVFVSDQYQRNILKSSCHECNEWVPVELGDDYKKHYDLMEVDDVNSGTHWKATAFNTEHHVSTGLYRHFSQLFFLPYTKSFSTPLGHLMMTVMNWQHYMQVWPQTSNLGFLLKVSPSVQQPVSSVDLAIRWGHEVTQTQPVVAPGTKCTTRITFAVKNKEQTVKSWDLNALLDMNAGHTVNKLKVHLTRTIPNQKDYKICIDGVKKYSHSEITGHVNVAMSQTSDNKCGTDNTVIDVTMKGEPSHDQTHDKHVYGHCNYIMPYAVQPYHTMQCIVDHTTVRKYVYNVKTKDVPSEFRKAFWRMYDYVKAHYHSHTYSEEHEEKLEEHTVKVEVVYPVEGHQVDIKIVTPQNVHYLSSLPTDHLELGGWGLAPDSTVFSQQFQFLHTMSDLGHCTIHLDHLHINVNDKDYEVKHALQNSWSLYVGEQMQNPKKGVYVMSVDNHVGIKVVDGDHVLEVLPKGHHFQITLDGKVVSEDSHHDDWVFWDIIKSIHEDARTMVVFMPNSGILVENHGHYVSVLTPDQVWKGHCFSH